MNRRGFLQALAALPLVGAIAAPIAKAVGEPTPLRMSVTAISSTSGVSFFLVYEDEAGGRHVLPMTEAGGQWSVNVPANAKLMQVQANHAIASGGHVSMMVSSV